MIDSGATAMFINRRFIKQFDILTRPLERTISLHNIDGSQNKAGSLTHSARLQLTVGSHTEQAEFLVTDLGPEEVILGLP